MFACPRTHTRICSAQRDHNHVWDHPCATSPFPWLINGERLGIASSRLISVRLWNLTLPMGVQPVSVALPQNNLGDSSCIQLCLELSLTWIPVTIFLACWMS